jgi:hypothetical protein
LRFAPPVLFHVVLLTRLHSSNKLCRIHLTVVRWYQRETSGKTTARCGRAIPSCIALFVQTPPEIPEIPGIIRRAWENIRILKGRFLVFLSALSTFGVRRQRSLTKLTTEP